MQRSNGSEVSIHGDFANQANATVCSI